MPIGGYRVAGNGTVDGGVLVDLSSLKGVHVDPAARTARVNGGVLVTADGRLVSASERENDDLLWGLRGGSSNLGVATS